MTLLSKLQSTDANAGVIGLGYVGLPLAIASARAGYKVTGFDVDHTKMALLEAGDSYIGAVSDAELARTSDQCRWTTDFSAIATCDELSSVCRPR